MKKIILIIVLIIMMGCQPKQNTLEFVITSMFSINNIPYLVEDKKIDENKFSAFYESYVTKECQKKMLSQLTIYQTTANTLNVIEYKETELNEHTLIECLIEIDKQKTKMIFHAQMEESKVISLKLITSKIIV